MKNIVASITKYVVTRKASYRAARASIALIAGLFFLVTAWLVFVPTASMQSQIIGAGAVVRHAPQINGRVEGSVRQLTGEAVTLNSGAAITGDLIVPGTPQLQINGNANFRGTVQGNGSAQPSGHRVTLNSGATLGHLVTRTDAIAMANVPSPPTPTGTRDVTLNSASQSVGDFATLRNLTLNSNVGIITVPPGTYGSFTINSGSGISLGVAGATQPSLYNLNALTLNSNGQIQVLGPVVLTVNLSVTLNASTGSSANPIWLKLNVATGGVTLNSGSVLYGIVRAPSGTVTLNGGRLNGSVFCDRLTINSGSILQGVGDSNPPSINLTQPPDNLVTTASQVTVTGTISDDTVVTLTVNGVTTLLNGQNFTAPVSLVEGVNTIRVIATDLFMNQREVTRTVFRDTSSPVISLVEPTQGAITQFVTIIGSVSDTTTVTITANGTPLDVDGGHFAGELALPEGVSQIRIVATDAAGNQAEVSRNVIIDATAPVISDLSPPEGSVISSTTATVQGRVTDSTAVTVTVNGVSATVGTNSLFTATGVPVREGSNSIVVTATDAAKNSTSVILLLNGNDQTPPQAPTVFATISPTRLDTQTIEGRAEPGSQVTITGGSEVTTTNSAFGTGLFVANVKLTAGANNLSVTVTDAAGNRSPAAEISIISNAGLPVPPAGQPYQINISTGDAQRGLINTELPRPLIAIVTDRDGSPVQGVAVRFTVTHGGGQIIGGSNSLDAMTDSLGHAIARYTSGDTSGIQTIRADFSGNTISPAIFTGEALKAYADGATNVTGLVLDQNLRALPNVLVRLGGQQTRTTADGRFVINNASSGPHQLLELIGRNQVALSGRWPNISYDIDVLPGVDNDLGRPLFLPKVNDGISMPLDANNTVTQNTTYELPVIGNEPPIRVTARAGTQVSFPPDATDKRLSVTRIPNNRVPMTLEEGRATSLYVSVQPSGAIFDPPLDVAFPNLDLLPASAQVLLMSFDHEAGRYVQAGTGRVSSDGKTVSSESGSGIRTGAWHGFPGNIPCPEVTVLGNINISGNPAFDDKAIVSAEAWVEGSRAVPMTGPNAASSARRLDYRASLSLPCGRTVLVKMEATASTVDTKIDATYVDQDNPANTDSRPLPLFGTVYGGSEPSTSDNLSLQVANVQNLPFRNFTWVVVGSGSQAYTPPPSGALNYLWSVGDVKPGAGLLTFQVAVELTDGRRFRMVRDIDFGVRTDDVIVVGWIDANGVPLSTIGVTPSILDALPSNTTPDSLKCNGLIGKLAFNFTGIGPFGRNLTDDERKYILFWMFKFAPNDDPTTVLPGSDFRDFSGNQVSEDEIRDYEAMHTSYKLFNRLQVKFRVKGSGFFGSPVVLHYSTSVGHTKNPCGPLPLGQLRIFEGQRGASDGKIHIDGSHISFINDGSPDAGAVRAFNTLTGKDLLPGQAAVFWEDIGSQIRFTYDGGTSPTVFVQPYPTYYEYRNGKLANVTRQAPTPLGNFVVNPYPFGTVPCDRAGGVTPGGRCGDATLPKDSSARTPQYTVP